MKPRTLSPSSIDKYEHCPARWKAENLEYAKDIRGAAADIGVVVHGVLEVFIVDGFYKKRFDGPARDAITAVYDNLYHSTFSDNSRYVEGLKLVMGWIERQDWSDREVLMAEVKRNFVIQTSVGPIKVNYIFDRMDKLDDGEIEVIDYKTYAMPVTPEQMRGRVQPRIYALAAQLMYPDAPRIWVTFDLLKYGPVGIAFTKDQNRETWLYVRAVAERIIADDGRDEKLNNECRWCLRKQVCKTLSSHIKAGGALSLSDPNQVANDRADLDAALAAGKAMLAEMDAYLLAYMEETGDDSIGGVQVKIRSMRSIDKLMAERVLGTNTPLNADGKVNITQIDKLLKGNTISEDQKRRLKVAIRRTPGAPHIASA